VHAHSPALVTMSMIREVPDTRILPQVFQVCGPVGYAPYAMMGSEQLGVNVAAAFASGPEASFHNTVLFENHGAAAGGADLLEAFQRFETLDFCARTLIHARGLAAVSGQGTVSLPLLGEECRALLKWASDDLPEYVPAYHGSRERELRRQVVEIVHRAYDRCLMTSTQGAVSARVNEDSFLITPKGIDRRAIGLEDVVLVAGGQRETNKWPSPRVRLHATIYGRHPEIGSVITAPAPHITAYALAPQTFDTKTIPESYVILRHLEKVSLDIYLREPEAVAGRLSARRPALIVENDGLLTTGTTILEAFDRLEIAEYSAQSLIDIATKLGEWTPLEEPRLRELEQGFGLE
jgi:L-fuculose-phosphate aldolase